ncbi:MAG: hypothetical protein E7K04_02760 [Helicobacter sp.]|nr:hypothetical protein [Helicobacter sp.]
MKPIISAFLRKNIVEKLFWLGFIALLIVAIFWLYFYDDLNFKKHSPKKQKEYVVLNYEDMAVKNDQILSDLIISKNQNQNSNQKVARYKLIGDFNKIIEAIYRLEKLPQNRIDKMDLKIDESSQRPALDVEILINDDVNLAYKRRIFAHKNIRNALFYPLELHLELIINKSAKINGAWYEEGDVLLGFKLAQVSLGYVILERRDGSVKKLLLE